MFINISKNLSSKWSASKIDEAQRQGEFILDVIPPVIVGTPREVKEQSVSFFLELIKLHEDILFDRSSVFCIEGGIEFSFYVSNIIKALGYKVVCSVCDKEGNFSEFREIV